MIGGEDDRERHGTEKLATGAEELIPECVQLDRVAAGRFHPRVVPAAVALGCFEVFIEERLAVHRLVDVADEVEEVAEHFCPRANVEVFRETLHGA